MSKPAVSCSNLPEFLSGVLMAFMCSFQLHAQEINLRLYTARDGLPSTYIFSPYQDRLGYLWIGTTSGLSRFDGKNFTNYSISDGLPDTRTITTMMDSKFRLWVGTSRGMVEFKNNRLISHPLSDSAKIRWVFQLLELSNGSVLAMTDKGVYRFETDKWEKISLYPGYENEPCRSIVESADGLFISYGKILVQQKSDGSFSIIGPWKEKQFYYNSLSKIGTDYFVNSIEGLYEIRSGQLKKLPGVLGNLKGNYFFLKDSKKRFWIGTEAYGLQLVTPDDYTKLTQVYHAPNVLIQSIYEDLQENLWIGTGGGLIKLTESGFKRADISGVLNGTVIRNILQSSSGPLLINNGTLSLITYENDLPGKKELIQKGNERINYNDFIIDQYAFDDQGRSWYVLRNMKLINQKGNIIEDQTLGLASLTDQVFDVLFDSVRKKITVATRMQKLPAIYNNGSYYPFPAANNIEVPGTIMRLHQCLNGNILFSTDLGRIYSIDKDNICRLQLNEFGSQGHISKFCNDPSGDVWILYEGRGLRRYSWNETRLTFKERLGKEDGLATEDISSFCFDNNNNLWVSTNANVTVFSRDPGGEDDPSNQIMHYYNTSEILAGNLENSKLFKDKKGYIWLFAEDYLISFLPLKNKKTYNPPSVHIEKIQLNLKNTNWHLYADSLTGIFQIPHRLSLAHDNSTLGIYYKGVFTSGTRGMNYTYILEGLEDSWSTPSYNDFVSFVKLPPGKYTFKVKARFLNTTWSDPAVFPFEIRKAFWQTWWFYFLTVVFVSAAIYSLFRYRLLQKIRILEIRNRISQDLHDEIGTSMSGINLLSQMAAEKLEYGKTEEAAEFLFKVKNYSHDVIEKLSDMVWIFNPQNDSIEKLLLRLRSFAVTIAVSKNIKLHFETDKASEGINLSIRQRKAIYLISKEAINNIFKYAGAANIYYSFHIRGPKWLLRIQDDGKGFNPEQHNEGNGLQNIVTRANEINASFNIQSQPGIGTIIIVEM